MNGSFDGRRGTVAWAIAGVAITLLVGFVVYSYIGALVVGVFLYYALRPVDRWLDERVDHPDVAATVSLLVVGLPILLVLGYAALTGARQADQFLQTANLEQYRSVLRPYLDAASLVTGQRLTSLLRSSLPGVARVAQFVLTWGLRLFVMITVAFYLLRDDFKIAGWFRRTFDGNAGAVDFFEGVDDDLTTIYTGNMITIGVTSGIAVAVFYGLDFAAPSGAGVSFPLLLGLLTGIATLVPAVGMKLVYFPYTAFLLLRSLEGGGGPLWFPAAFFVATLILVDVVPDFFIRSYLTKGDLNMGLMLLTYVLGAAVFGWYGVFFGPIVLVLFLHFARRVLPNLLDDRAAQFVSD